MQSVHSKVTLSLKPDEPVSSFHECTSQFPPNKPVVCFPAMCEGDRLRNMGIEEGGEKPCAWLGCLDGERGECN